MDSMAPTATFAGAIQEDAEWRIAQSSVKFNSRALFDDPLWKATDYERQAVDADFHKRIGEIQRRADGTVDLVAEMSKHPDALWIKVKAIEADIPNDNGDLFSEEEILKSYKTFEGCPVFTNHENNKVEAAKGKVVVAVLSGGNVDAELFSRLVA
jgi:hypothetical protein